MDEGDAGLDGVGDGERLALDAVDADHAAGRRGDAAENFIRVDLPAPFSPIRPITSPRRDRQRHAVERDHAGIGLADVEEFEEGRASGPMRRHVGGQKSDRRRPATGERRPRPHLHPASATSVGATSPRRPVVQPTCRIIGFIDAMKSSTLDLSMTLPGTMMMPFAGTPDLSPSRYFAISFMP